MNVIYHPTASLAKLIIDSDNSPLFPVAICRALLRVILMPSFLAIELAFKAIPQHLYLHFTANQQIRDKSTENIQKLFNGIFFNSNILFDLNTSIIALMSLEDQQRLVAQNPFRLRDTSLEIRQNHEIVMRVVQTAGTCLRFASEDLKNNPDIVRAAIQNDAFALQYASRNLKDNHEIVLMAVQQNGYLIQFASERLKNDRPLVLAAVKNNIHAFEQIPIHFRNDRELVFEAVKIDGMALRYASRALRNDHEIVITAVRNKGRVLVYASDDLKSDPEIYNIYLHSLLPDNVCKFEDKRYVPKALSPELKSIQLPNLPGFATLEHLNESLSLFIRDLQPRELDVIRRELGREDLSLSSAKSLLLVYHNQLFTRVNQRSAYLGTPPAGSTELTKFYDNIEIYLKHLDVFLSKEENSPPNALIERLQILQTQTACGARFQSELEQLFSMNCISGDLMSLDKQCALIASTCLKQAIQSMAGSDVHSINILSWQLDAFVVGDSVVRDQLAHPIDEFQLNRNFLEKHTALNIIDHVQKALKTGSDFESLFSEYIKENFSIEFTDEDHQIIEERAHDLWQDYREVKRQKFLEYSKAKAGRGIYGSIQDNSKLSEIFGLGHQEALCQTLEEFDLNLESSKESVLESFLEDALSDYTIEKIYDRYFDQNENKWNKSIIAITLEKMGILQAM